jgi:hypothetical protein
LPFMVCRKGRNIQDSQLGGRGRRGVYGDGYQTD